MGTTSVLVWFSCVRFCSFFFLDSLWIRFALVAKDFLGLDLNSDGFHGFLRSAYFTTCATCTAHFSRGGGTASPTCLACCNTLKIAWACVAVYAPVAEFSDHCSGVRRRRCSCISSRGREDNLRKE